MEFKGLTSASHMSLPEAGYGSEEGQLGSEISGAVSGVTTPGASRLQASQLQERSTTMQRLQTVLMGQVLTLGVDMMNLLLSFVCCTSSQGSKGHKGLSLLPERCP